jgi:biopolymer transport protein ExbD
MPLKIQHEQEPTLNLTSMIDVVFLLIIFFMVGTKFADVERQIQLEVPQVSQFSTLPAASAKHIIHVGRQGELLLDNRVVTRTELTQELESAARHTAASVVIRGDAQGALQHVATVLGACREAGVQDIAIAVQPEPRARR